MAVKVAIPDLISPSYFPVIAAVTLGYFEREGIDADLDLIFPVTRAYQALRDGDADLVGGSAHAPGYVARGWEDFSLLCALSQNMYWFLVVKKGLEGERGDLDAVKGLRIGAAPGPVDGLRQMLLSVGIDPDEDVRIGPVPGSSEAGISFGVTAAKALAAGELDGFWANGMAADVAVGTGVGAVVVDSRRGEGPGGASDYTFAALVATKARIEADPEMSRAAIRAIVRTQKALAENPDLATQAVADDLFPPDEASRIAELVRRDAPFYDAAIAPSKVAALNAFVADLGKLEGAPPAYDEVVATGLSDEWRVD